MKRKWLIIALVIIAVLSVVGIFLARQIYHNVNVREDISGSQGTIPKRADVFTPINGRSGYLACWKLMDGKLLWKQNVRDASAQM